jgi:hypothetical protein
MVVPPRRAPPRPRPTSQQSHTSATTETTAFHSTSQFSLPFPPPGQSAMTTSHAPLNPPHQGMPASLQLALDKYSVAIQKYRALLSRVSTNDRVPRLRKLPKRRDLKSVVERTVVVNTQCQNLERLLHEQRNDYEKLPPHKRVLLDPPVGASPRNTVGCAFISHHQCNATQTNKVQLSLTHAMGSLIRI